MGEYNWRKEREKFRPDFRKTPAEKPTEQTPQPVVSQPERSGLSAAWLIAGLLIALIVIGIVMTAKTVGSRRNADTPALLSQAAEKNKRAVGLVVLTVTHQNGAKLPIPIGTAWAFEKNKFATNAHVAKGLTETIVDIKKMMGIEMLKEIAAKNGCKTPEELQKKIGKEKAETLARECMENVEKMIRGFEVSIQINGSHRQGYPVVYVQIHRDFGLANTKFNPDVAVFTIEGTHDCFFPMAKTEVLHSLKSGEPVAFLGFPMEKLSRDNVNVDNPVASMQSGIIVAVSDFEMKDAGKNGNLLIRHNLPSTGGASGSPIFNKDGDVIALLFAGNVIGQVRNGKIEDRAPSAAQINFAVRVDLLKDMGDPVEIQTFLKQ